MSILGAVVRWCLALLGALVAVLLVCPIQSLPKAQVAIHGTVTGTGGAPVKVTVRRSGDYGLTPSERAAGLDPLNKPAEQEIALAGSFDATLPPAYYCVTAPIWAKRPPPVALTLTFSDAPDEHYTVLKSKGVTSYYVTNTAGVDVAQQHAGWRLAIGELTQEAAGYPLRWRLELRVERNSQNPPRKGAATV